MTRLLADQTTNTTSSKKKYDELDADFKRLFREILGDAEEEDTNGASSSSSSSGDKSIDSMMDFKTRKKEDTTEDIFAMNAEEEEEEELRAKTSYVMDVSSLEENEALKIARIRERQMKDFEIERLKRTVKMLCEARMASSSKKRKEDEDAESIDDVLTEYDEELKRREAIIANLREELRETRRNAADDSRALRKPGVSSSSALKLNANRNDEKEEILFLRRELRKSETAREKDAAKHHDLTLREKRVSLREKAATTRDKRLELLESERGKILARAKTAETAVATLTSSSEKLEKQNQLLLEQLRVLRKREVDADRYSKRLYYYY